MAEQAHPCLMDVLLTKYKEEGLEDSAEDFCAFAKNWLAAQTGAVIQVDGALCVVLGGQGAPYALLPAGTTPSFSRTDPTAWAKLSSLSGQQNQYPTDTGAVQI